MAAAEDPAYCLSISLSHKSLPFLLKEREALFVVREYAFLPLGINQTVPLPFLLFTAFDEKKMISQDSGPERLLKAA